MAAEGGWKVGEKYHERHSIAFATKQSPPLPPKDRHTGQYRYPSPYCNDRRSSETNSFDSRTGSSADLCEPIGKQLPTTLQDESLIPRRGASFQNIESWNLLPPHSPSPKKSSSPSKPPTGKPLSLPPKRVENNNVQFSAHQKSPSFNTNLRGIFLSMR